LLPLQIIVWNVFACMCSIVIWWCS